MRAVASAVVAELGADGGLCTIVVLMLVLVFFGS
jgi:hypothetical protein